MLTTRQLKYFAEIAARRSFSEAAARLHVAQSALSRQVRDMELEIGVRLLVRGPRQVELTEAGHVMLVHARRVLADLADASARARMAERGIVGSIRLLHSSSVPPDPDLLRALRAHVGRHPGVTVEFGTASSEQQALDIEEGRADIGLARAPVLREYPLVARHPLRAENLLLATSRTHRLARRRSVAVEELAAEPFVAVAHRERGGLGHRVAQLCRQHGFFPSEARVTSRKLSQFGLVAAGFGIAIVPETMARFAPADVRLIRLRGDDVGTEVVLLCRTKPSGHIDGFVRHLLTTFQGGGSSSPAIRRNGSQGTRQGVPPCPDH